MLVRSDLRVGTQWALLLSTVLINHVVVVIIAESGTRPIGILLRGLAVVVTGAAVGIIRHFQGWYGNVSGVTDLVTPDSPEWRSHLHWGTVHPGP